MSQGRVSANGDKVLVALGSNVASAVGGPRDTVLAALGAIGERFGDVQASALYQTPAFPAGSGDDFVNAACVFHSTRAPAEILSILHDIEAQFGRTREVRWGQRTLDLDLIAVGQTIAPDDAIQTRWRTLPLDSQITDAPDQLILPHPRLQDRAFVLVPLADIAPDWVHPLTKNTVTDMLAKCPAQDRRDVVALT